MHIIAVPHDQQAVRINITDHGIDLHRTDYIFMKMLVQPFRPAEHMPLDNIDHIPEGELVRDIARLFLHTDCADPLLGDHNPQILGFLHRTVSRPFTDDHFLRELTD
ncbi:hypothetical protein D3C81_1989310 [compost metagenome]